MSPEYPRSQFAFEKPARVVVWLIAINAILWFGFAVVVNSLTNRSAADLYMLLWLDPHKVLPGGYVWQLLTYSWLHDLEQISHVLFNLIALYFLGSPLAKRWGTRTFLKFYLLSGVIAGAFSVLVGVTIGWRFDTPIVGASGAIFGLVTAYALVLPNAQFLLFFVLPMRARHMVWLALGIDALLFLAVPSYNIAIHTHLGGAFAGWLLVTGNWHPKVFGPRLKALFARRKVRVYRIIDGGKGKRPGSDRDYLN